MPKSIAFASQLTWDYQDNFFNVSGSRVEVFSLVKVSNHPLNLIFF
jgi:hypothetical protein